MSAPPTDRGPIGRAAARLLDRERAWAVGFGVALTLGVVVVSGPVQTWLEHRDRAETLSTQLGAIEEANVGLADRVEELNDPEQVELAAREEQGMVRPGEVPYVIVPPEVDEPVIGIEAPVAEDDRGMLRRGWDALVGLFGG